MAQYAAYCTAKLRWALPEFLNIILATPRRCVPAMCDDISILRRYRAFAQASIRWWNEQEDAASKRARAGAETGREGE